VRNKKDKFRRVLLFELLDHTRFDTNVQVWKGRLPISSLVEVIRYCNHSPSTLSVDLDMIYYQRKHYGMESLLYYNSQYQ
jgi:hypothetical protein